MHWSQHTACVWMSEFRSLHTRQPLRANASLSVTPITLRQLDLKVCYRVIKPLTAPRDYTCRSEPVHLQARSSGDHGVADSGLNHNGSGSDGDGVNSDADDSTVRWTTVYSSTRKSATTSAGATATTTEAPPGACSYAELLMRGTTRRRALLVGPPTVFVSHAWQYVAPSPCL